MPEEIDPSWLKASKLELASLGLKRVGTVTLPLNFVPFVPEIEITDKEIFSFHGDVVRDIIDVSTDGDEQFIPRLARGEITINGAFSLELLDAIRSCWADVDRPHRFRLIVQGTIYEFEGWVRRFSTGAECVEITVQPSGPVTVREEGEEQVAPKNDKMPRFYVGSASVFKPGYGGSEPWAKFTEKEAIDQAKALVESTGKEQFIVKIIKVVRRKPQPVVVETVRG